MIRKRKRVNIRFSTSADQANIIFNSLDMANATNHFSINKHNYISSIKCCHFQKVTSCTCGDQTVIVHVFTRFQNLCLISMYKNML